MLDHGVDQGMGLRHLGMFSSARVIAVTSHGDPREELPLLCSLCEELVAMGHPVTVLDGTAEETESRGLAPMLQTRHWQSTQSADSGRWQILPSAQGLKDMCQRRDRSMPPLQDLQGVFGSDQVVVIYASGETLGQLLKHSPIRPLLGVSNTTTSLLTAYTAIKHMYLEGQVHPTIVSVCPEERVSDEFKNVMAGVSLHACASTFLGCSLPSPMIAHTENGEFSSSDLTLLSTRLLEAAAQLDHPLQGALMSDEEKPLNPYLRSH